MYSKRFNNVTKFLQDYVDNGEIAGASLCIVKMGKKIYRENIGFANKEKNIPISNNTIYRIFSMTKPIISVGMMILCERGLFDLYDPVSKFIPAYKNQHVITSNGLESVRKDVTIKNLFNMTSGIPYPDSTTVSGMEMNKIFAKMSSDMEKGILWSTQKFVEAFASVPLIFQPGEHWMYGVSADIMGALIEIISGKTLGEFLKEEIFEPLGMVDTGFWIPKEKKERFAQVYEFNKSDKLIPYTKKHLCLNNYFSSPNYESGGAGLVSTIDDYEKFAHMLLNDGMFNCQKILSRKSVELMSTNQLTTNQLNERNWESERGYGYGMLMRTMLVPHESGCLGSVGEFGWDSFTGSWFCVNPEERLIALCMMQNAFLDSYSMISKLKNTIYSSIE